MPLSRRSFKSAEDLFNSRIIKSVETTMATTSKDYGPRIQVLNKNTVRMELNKDIIIMSKFTD
jgi:hypothetical protein